MMHVLVVALTLNLVGSLFATPVVNHTKRRINFIVVKGSTENPQFEEYAIRRGATADIKFDEAPVLQFEAYYMTKKGGKAEGKESVYPVLGKECFDCIKSRPGLALSVVPEKIHDVHHRNRRGPAIKVVAPMYMPSVAVAAEESDVDESADMEEGDDMGSSSDEEGGNMEGEQMMVAMQEQGAGEEPEANQEDMNEEVEAADDMMEEEMPMEDGDDE